VSDGLRRLRFCDFYVISLPFVIFGLVVFFVCLLSAPFSLRWYCSLCWLCCLSACIAPPSIAPPMAMPIGKNAFAGVTRVNVKNRTANRVFQLNIVASISLELSRSDWSLVDNSGSDWHHTICVWYENTATCA